MKQELSPIFKVVLSIGGYFSLFTAQFVLQAFYSYGSRSFDVFDILHRGFFRAYIPFQILYFNLRIMCTAIAAYFFLNPEMKKEVQALGFPEVYKNMATNAVLIAGALVVIYVTIVLFERRSNTTISSIFFYVVVPGLLWLVGTQFIAIL